MKVVTAGVPYIDIDAYAGCIAYAELLRLQGHDAIAASSARLNESIPQVVRAWGATMATDYKAGPEDTYFLVDVTDPKHFDTFVDLERIDTVIDHHPHFIEYWHERLGERGIIDFIGSAATLVYEQWELAGVQDQISQTSARLLICAILDNTLNFKASVSTERDERAYQALLQRANLPDDWTAQYFNACQQGVIEDVPTAIRDDLKRLNFKTLQYDEPIAVGQLVVWDAREVMASGTSLIYEAMGELDETWLMSIVSINEAKNYFITDDVVIQKWLESLVSATFDGNSAQTERMWLRKEIMQQDNMHKSNI